MALNVIGDKGGEGYDDSMMGGSAYFDPANPPLYRPPNNPSTQLVSGRIDALVC